MRESRVLVATGAEEEGIEEEEREVSWFDVFFGETTREREAQRLLPMYMVVVVAGCGVRGTGIHERSSTVKRGEAGNVVRSRCGYGSMNFRAG